MFESLGQRRVLAVITGSVFEDLDGSMRQDSWESPAAARLAYIDANQNGQFDSGERFDLTDEQGYFRFDDVPAGIHSVRLFDGSESQRQTFPTAASESSLPTSFHQAVDTGLADETVHVLTGSGLIRAEASGTRVSTTPLGFTPDGLVASVTSGGPYAVSASIIAGNFSELGEPRSGLWLVPSGSTGARLLQYEAQPDAISKSGAGVGSDGHGVLVVQREGYAELHRIHVTPTSDSDLSGNISNVTVTSTSIDVPPGTTVMSSSSAINLRDLEAPQGVGSRSVLAWPTTTSTGNVGSGFEPTTSLVASLWSNSAGDWIAGTQTALVGVTELLDFDDQGGLLAVRYHDGTVGVLDVDAGFAPIDQLNIGDAPLSLIEGQDTVAMIQGVANPYYLTVHNLRDGQTLFHEPIDLHQVGAPRSVHANSTTGTYIVVGERGVRKIEFNQPDGHRVSINRPTDVKQVRFGVQKTKHNTPPQVQPTAAFQLLEDAPLTIAAGDLAGLVTDANGDQLVSLIAEAPKHGQVSIGAGGQIQYRPDRDFFGSDSFAVQLHDGVSVSAPILFDLSIIGRPDPPSGVSLQADGIPEHTQGPYVVGPLSVLDVDPTDDYELGVSDPRFAIENGNLVLVGGGLDFEFEPSILVTVHGYDSQAGQYFSSDVMLYVEDENDPVVEVGPEQGSVDENSDNVFITDLYSYDQDTNQITTYSVDDDRFMIVGDELWLKQGETVDYETEPVVVLTITADDNAGSTNSTELRVIVHDVPEAVTSITLSNESVLELEEGATVGEVHINGYAAANSYTLSVDDARFEIDGAELKLLDDQFVRRSDAEQIELTITAQDRSQQFGSLSETFIIEVVENGTPFHNDDNPYDVDGNGEITPRDALAIINYLNLYGPGPVGPGDPGYGYDVNGDGQVTALDALLIINVLNTLRNGGTVGGTNAGPGAGENPGENETPGTPDGQSNDSDTSLRSNVSGNQPAGDDAPSNLSQGTVASTNDPPSVLNETSGVPWSSDSGQAGEVDAAIASDWLRDIRTEDDDESGLNEAIDGLLNLLGSE